MRRSPLVPLLTVLIVLPLTLTGIGLLAAGAMRVRYSLMYRPDPMASSLGLDRLVSDGGLLKDPLLLSGAAMQLGGAALLIVVTLTALWSSAGLLSVSGIALLTLLLSAFPLVLLHGTMSLPGMSAMVQTVHTALYTGAPHILCAVLTAVGLSAWLLRRSAVRTAPPSQGNPARSVVSTVLGIAAYVIAPLLLVLGTLLLARGLMGARAVMLNVGDLGRDPLWALVLVAALLLIAGGTFAARWAPLALVLPAIAALLFAGLSYFPEFLYQLASTSPLLPDLLAATSLGAAGVLATSVIVLVVVRRRTARAAHAHQPTVQQQVSAQTGQAFQAGYSSQPTHSPTQSISDAGPAPRSHSAPQPPPEPPNQPPPFR